MKRCGIDKTGSCHLWRHSCATARECAEWIRRKVTFRSNATKSSMQQMACVQSPVEEPTVNFPLQGFTAVDLGYQETVVWKKLFNFQRDAAVGIINKLETCNVSLAGQQRGIRALMTVNLLKRLESSVQAFRLTLRKLAATNQAMLSQITNHESGKAPVKSVSSSIVGEFDPDDDDLPDSDEMTFGGKMEISFEDLDDFELIAFIVIQEVKA